MTATAETMTVVLDRPQADGLREYLAEYEWIYERERIGLDGSSTYDDHREGVGEMAALAALIAQLDQPGDSVTYTDDREHLTHAIYQAIDLATSWADDYARALGREDVRERMAGLAQHPDGPPTVAEVLDVVERNGERIARLAALYRVVAPEVE